MKSLVASQPRWGPSGANGPGRGLYLVRILFNIVTCQHSPTARAARLKEYLRKQRVVLFLPVGNEIVSDFLQVKCEISTGRSAFSDLKILENSEKFTYKFSKSVVFSSFWRLILKPWDHSRVMWIAMAKWVSTLLPSSLSLKQGRQKHI